ncbi:uncharacterized protein [Onthophagus taurus]|uniref:uncharacterized protein n=1 Tax=Onthophagus taurus TaxID=166361 RepID=UPI000C20A8E8|nr:uncharacterized protein LOC111413374 [Onthophagus taurus]
MCEPARLFLPLETLEKLVCSECKGYLRSGPIKVRLDGESVCGKCSVNPKHSAPLIHHKAFEEIIQLISFPCKYYKFGCPEYILYDDNTKHEDSCAFRIYYCPGDRLGCYWKGTSVQLLEHYREKHLELFATTTTFEIDLTEDIEESKLYTQDNVSFLIKFKVSKEDGKFWIIIEHLGHIEETTPVTYKITLHTSEENGLKMVMKERKTSYAPRYTVFDVKNFQVVDINSLLTILENPENIYCSIELKIPPQLIQDIESKLQAIKCPHCLKYMTPPIYICQESHNSCEDCVGYNKKCKSCNKENTYFTRHQSLEVTSASSQLPCRWTSCKFVGDFTNIRKHEKTCHQRRYKCPRCYNWHGSYEQITEHFEKEHETHPLLLTKKVSIARTTRVYDFYLLVFGDIFGCSVFSTDENEKNFSLWYYGLPTFYDKYEYRIHLADKNEEDDSQPEIIKTYKLQKCCATENCFSFNLKIPNEDMTKHDYPESLYFIFEIVERI